MLVSSRFRSMPWAFLFISLLLTACIVSTDHREPTPEQVIPRLTAVLKDPNPELRRTAAQALGKIAYASSLPALVEALHDPDPVVRRNAAWAIGMIGPDEFDWSPVILLLFDSDHSVREAAGLTLGLTGANQDGAEFLQERLHDPKLSTDTKRLGVLALGSMVRRSETGIIIKMLQDPEARVRRWAVAALGEIADAQAVKPLGALLATDPDPGVRLEAAFRLGKFGGAAARPALVSALKDADENVRRLTQAALKER